MLINYVNVQCWSDPDVFYVDLRLSVTTLYYVYVYVLMSERRDFIPMNRITKFAGEKCGEDHRWGGCVLVFHLLKQRIQLCQTGRTRGKSR